MRDEIGFCRQKSMNDKNELEQFSISQLYTLDVPSAHILYSLKEKALEEKTMLSVTVIYFWTLSLTECKLRDCENSCSMQSLLKW